MHFLPHRVLGQTLLLTNERCIYWEEKKSLLLSDLHLGKSGHFRKNGIGIPGAAMKNDLHRLGALIQFFKPEQIIISGDLFHSRHNMEHDMFTGFRKNFAQTTFILIKGNHDILDEDRYNDAGIIQAGDFLEVDEFYFSHEPLPKETKGSYGFTGHIHPGIRLAGKGRQYISMPCYYFTPNHCILPAFGSFTGYVTMEPKPGDEVYAITGQEVQKII
jgi:DNA ligase-associated metallophosphoesterase